MYKINKQISVKQLLSINISFLFVFQPVMATDIVIDATRTHQNTSLDTAANGTSIVNISTPNTNGVSHNTYIQFNVPTQGTILNNSGQEVNTQLAGYIYGNENVNHGSASLILNEVSGTNRSHLHGYLEVAGESADVIVANPNGVTVNGAGFINIPKATLTTGKVSFTGNRPIFDIEGGDIFIDGKGLDAKGTSSLELYTQAIKLNAKLYANDLRIVTGLNYIDEDGEVSSRDGEEKERPAFSMDSTVLGGIYANAISLVGTQKGVGVHLPSEMLVQDRLEISADGKIILGKVSVKNRANIRSNSSSIEIIEGVHASTIDLQALTDISLYGNTGATTNLTLLGTTLYNEGLLAAGINADFIQAQEGLLSLGFTQSINNVGVLYGSSGTTVDTKNFINADQAEVITQTFTLNATETLTNSGELRANFTTLNTQTLSNTGFIYGNDVMSITAESVNNTHGRIEGLDRVSLNIANEFLNNNGILFSDKTLTLNTDSLNNIEGSIQANETLTIHTSGDLDNTRGTLYSGAGTTVTAQTLNNEEGFIGSLKAVFLDLFNLNGDHGNISGEGVTIHTANINSNNATIQSTGGLDLVASGGVALEDSAVLSNDDLSIKAQTLNLSNTLLFAQNSGTINTGIFNNLNSVVSGTQMHINTIAFNNTNSYLYSSGGTVKITTDTMDNSHGLISANGDLILDAQSLDNRYGDLEAGNTLELTSNTVQIEGSRFFGGDHLSMTSNISNIDVDTKFLSGNSMALEFTGNLVHQGEILANGTGEITVHGNLDNHSSIIANNALNIVANTLNNNVNDTGASIRGGDLSTLMLNGNLNNHGFITSSGNLDVSAHDINNHAGIATGDALTLNSTNFYNYHTLLSGTDMHLYISNLLRNNEDADIYAGNTLTIAKDDTGEKTQQVENISAKIESGGDMHISAMDIFNISATEITTTLQEVNGMIDITCGDWGSFSCPDTNIALDIDLMAIKAKIIQENSDNGIILTQSELQVLLTEEMLKQDRQAYILNMYKDTQTTANELYFYELTASLDSNEMIVKRIKPHKKEEFRKVNYTVSEEIVDAVSLANHKEGKIVSGHDLSINADTLINKTSLIAATNDMEINANLENAGVGSTESIDATINYSWKRKSDGGLGQLPISKFEIRDTEGVPSQILAGGTLSGNFGILQNGMQSDISVSIDPDAPTISTSTQTTNETQENVRNIDTTNVESQIEEAITNTALSLIPEVYDHSIEDITLPNNPYGLFVTSKNPDGPLIESNPEYTDYNNYVSSEYMFERLGYDGSSQMRRLGDAMYETQLIRDAIITMTGQRYIGTAQNDNDQYMNLMNAGLTYAQEVGLQLGVAPTIKQLENLTEDLVWMEVKTVEGKQVLVPVLYLAKEYNKPTDAHIAANSMNLTVDGHLGNSGNIQTRQDMNLRTGTITNVRGNIEAGRNMHISAVGDIKNLSANIKGGSVVLASTQGNIVNKSLSKGIDLQHNVGTEHYTIIDKAASIEATKGHLLLDAAKNIENTGANLTSKGDMALKAKENINIKTLKDEKSYDYTFDNGYTKGESVEYMQSNVQAGEQLSVLADKNINLEAVNIDTGNTHINAKEKVNITAVSDSKYTESHFEDDGFLSSSASTDIKLSQSVKGTTIETANLVVEGNKGVSVESMTANVENSAQITSKTGNVDFTAKAYTNASYHEESNSMLGGLISERSVDSVSETLLADSSTKAENNIIVSGKDINLVATDLESTKGGIKLAATEHVNIVSDMEARSETHIREESGLSLGYSSGRLTFAEETTDSTETTSYTNKASTIKTNTLLIESGQDTNVIASNITAGDMRVDASRDFNVLSDKDITMKNEEHSKKEIGIEFTLNSEEASVFAGYWENKNTESSTDSQVVSSNINVGSLEVNSESTNVVGSNIAGQDININSENIRILSDSTNTNADAYTKSIKAGIEVGVKQNLSNAVNAIANVGEAESGSAIGARGLQAYDAVQSFSEQPVTAGVNAIYEESSTDTHSANSQVVASSITATNTLALNAKNELEIAGSDVGSANTLTVNANNINIHASQGTYSTETSSETKNARVGLYGTNMGQATVGYQENEMTTTGTYQRNSQLYAGDAASITSTQDTTLSGANINTKDLTLNVGGDLNMQSLQDTQTIDGRNKGGSLSGGLGGVTGASSNTGETTGEKAWVSQTTGINGSDSVVVNVSDTTTLTGASITNLDAEGKDQGNLELNTQHLVVNDIKDIDSYDATTAGVGVGSNDGAPSLNSVEYTNNTKDKEQITRAIIGTGTINTGTTTGTLNRDTTKMQEITRDEESNTELYGSDRSLALLDNPTGSIVNLGNKLKGVGLAAHVEILENLPSASRGNQDKDGNPIRENGEEKNSIENFLDNTIGAGLDYTSNAGILPSAGNDGGYVTQLAIQLFGDNRAGIVVEDKAIMENLGLKERKERGKTTDWDYEQVVMVKTEDGIKPISEVENIEGLEQVTRYRTNPDKQLVIGDPKDRSGNANIEEYKIRISTEDIKASDIKHVFTNGMFNDHDTAVFNQQTQQNGADAILNYNQMHGVLGDMIENVQDHLSINGADILTEVVTLGQAEGSVDGIGYLGTGGSRQTGNLINQMTTIRQGDLTIGAHSQGTMMTQNGLDQHKEDLGKTVQDNANASFLLQYSGAPVNHVITENTMTEIYGGVQIVEERTKGKGINNVFRSQVAPEDFVGSVLGYQSAGINNSENLGENMKESTISAGRLFGMGGSSTHSYYGCVIGCGNENYTPKNLFYVNPDINSEAQELPLQNYYETNFVKKDDQGNILKDQKGNNVIDVKLDLYPRSIQENGRNKKVEIILDSSGDKQ